MPIDNDLYNRLAHTWWEQDGALTLIRTGLNGARFGYFRQVMLERLGMKPEGLRALDIGCGGGYLAEEFTRLGCRVSGIDPSPASIDAARAHARATGLDIEYRVSGGESIPYADGTFDIVYCCDVLEHVHDLDRVIAETSRVLKPGGIYFFDTINRTWRSRLIEIKVLQEWPLTRVQPKDLHDWNMFIKPGELQAVLNRHALDKRHLVGLKPRVSPIRLFRTLRGVRKGKVSYAEAGERLNMGVTRDVSELYMGYALRGSSGVPARA
jgi:2-polyprenyl-6-hydroxyphenyl methylase/3-demethylubiquinone-9 3-methyltransferase